MSRPHRDFVDLADIAPTAPDGPLAGAAKRLLSRDADSGAETAVVTLPAGWSASLTGLDGSLELLSISGAVVLGGRTVADHGWARAPLAREAGELAAPGGAELLLMTDPAAAVEGDLAIVDVDGEPWRRPARGGPDGVAVKTLHEGEAVSLIIANVPRYRSGPEFHAVPEELFVLAGEVEGRPGRMRAGSYFWRPAWITHGPYWSPSGLLTFVRGHGDIVAYWIDDPDSTIEQNRHIHEQIEADR